MSMVVGCLWRLQWFVPVEIEWLLPTARLAVCRLEFPLSPRDLSVLYVLFTSPERSLARRALYSYIFDLCTPTPLSDFLLATANRSPSFLYLLTLLKVFIFSKIVKLPSLYCLDKMALNVFGNTLTLSSFHYLGFPGQLVHYNF